MHCFNFSNIKSRISPHLSRKNSYWGGFTILEIIITIVVFTILTITIFSSYIWYTLRARDSTRVSDINNLKSGLLIHKMKWGILPMPEWIILTGSIYGKNVSFNWDVWDSISKLANISSTPKDPFNKQYYSYWISFNNKFFQVAATLENEDNLVFNDFVNKISVGDLVNANEDKDIKKYSALVLWNYPWYIKFSTWSNYYITNSPSLIFNFSWSNIDGNLLSSTNTFYVLNRQINLPYSINNDFNINQIKWDDILKIMTNNQVATLTWIIITPIINWLVTIDSVFSWETLDQFGYDISIISKIIWNINPNSSLSNTPILVGIWNGSWTTANPYYYSENSTIKYPVSCNDILINTWISFTWANTNTAVTYTWINISKFNDWYYFIDPDGLGWDTEFYTYCDMTSDWWGWSKITPTILDWQISLMRNINMQQMVKCTDLSPYFTISPVSSNSWSWSSSYWLWWNRNENGVIKSCPVDEIQYSTFWFNCSNWWWTTWKILLNNNSNPWAYADTSALPCKSGAQITNLSIFIR